MCLCQTKFQGEVSHHFGGSADLPEKVSRDMGYRSDSIAISRDMGPLREGMLVMVILFLLEDARGPGGTRLVVFPRFFTTSRDPYPLPGGSLTPNPHNLPAGTSPPRMSFERRRGQGVSARERDRRVWQWEYYEPGTPPEPGPLTSLILSLSSFLFLLSLSLSLSMSLYPSLSLYIPLSLSLYPPLFLSLSLSLYPSLSLPWR